MLVNIRLMDERDYRTYVLLFRHISNFMCRLNVIVYLDVSPEESMKHIQLRSHDVESGISLEYLTTLYDEYERFIKNTSPTISEIRGDWSRFRDAEEMAQVIAWAYPPQQFSEDHEVGADQPIRTVKIRPPLSHPLAEFC